MIYDSINAFMNPKMKKIPITSNSICLDKIEVNTAVNAPINTQTREVEVIDF